MPFAPKPNPQDQQSAVALVLRTLPTNRPRPYYLSAHERAAPIAISTIDADRKLLAARISGPPMGAIRIQADLIPEVQLYDHYSILCVADKF